MKSKHWLITFLLLFFVGMAGYMSVNFHIDPLGYFIVKKGEAYYDWNDYTREIKSEYLTKHNGQYDAVVIGGSKAGALSTQLLSEYTGKKYYNFYFNSGNFSDYLVYSKYLAENTDISEITLHLSSFEVTRYSMASSNVLDIPAMISGNLWNKATENLSYLLTDINTLLDNIDKRKNTALMDDVSNGERNLMRSYRKFPSNPKRYVKSRVTKDLDKHLTNLFGQSASSAPAFDENLNALREIQKICEEHEITLKVIIGASFLGEHNLYECDRYYDYLHELVTITDVWDFSDFNDINMNPYNFIDRRHYNNGVANLMVDTMYGNAPFRGFGRYLTKDNINEYLTQRKEQLEVLRKEFDETGTVALQNMKDDSYIPEP